MESPSDVSFLYCSLMRIYFSESINETLKTSEYELKMP